MSADDYRRITTTFPAALDTVAREHAAAEGHPSFAAYLVDLVTTDLRRAGKEPPALPLPGVRTRKPRGVESR
jgi:hypothetical protein